MLEEREAAFPVWFVREGLRLDVDGLYPQMVASGTVTRFITSRVDWIADVKANGPNSWNGTIWYKDGDVASFPYTDVEIQVTRSWFYNQRTATATFSGGGAGNRVRTFKYKSPYFHPVEFEFDCAEGETATILMDTCAHPNRPATLLCENLSIQTVFRRAGFDVKTSPAPSVVPLAGAGSDAEWSDMEMHDAMQVYWSLFADQAQWAMWTFFASLHEIGTSLGGIMFDDIGPNHRQGTAIFNDSFVSNAPSGDANPAAWVQRMLFWTACHEMGHSFNLAHSWQKALGTPWIPLANEPEARSFMNYPYFVSGGQAAFFADFEFRFSDNELLFMRHAPARFVQMGNADWFDHHGFQQANVSPEPALKLELRVNRESAVFEFLEPVVLELKLTNVSTQPQLINESLLSSLDRMTTVLKKDGKPARQFFPYTQYCWQPSKMILMPGQSDYESLFVSAGRNGWDLAEPGYYIVQVAVHLGNEDIVSNPLRLRVAPPRGYDEEYLAQDFFTDDVGRVFTFDGTRFLTKGNDTLRETVARFSDRKVAHHARVALGNPLARGYKQLDLGEDRRQVMRVHEAGGKIMVASADEGEAGREFAAALTEQPDEAAETLGHIDYKYYTDRFSDWLAELGQAKEAKEVQNGLLQTLTARDVLDRVLEEIKARGAGYK